MMVEATCPDCDTDYKIETGYKSVEYKWGDGEKAYSKFSCECGSIEIKTANIKEAIKFLRKKIKNQYSENIKFLKEQITSVECSLKEAKERYEKAEAELRRIEDPAIKIAEEQLAGFKTKLFERLRDIPTTCGDCYMCRKSNKLDIWTDVYTCTLNNEVIGSLDHKIHPRTKGVLNKTKYCKSIQKILANTKSDEHSEPY